MLNKKLLPLWRGLIALFAALLALFIVTSAIAEDQKAYIDEALGTKSQSFITDEDDGTDLYAYRSTYSTTKEMVDANIAFSAEMEENGAVLLKNKGGALPLKAAENKVSLVGKAAYANVLGGQMGSGAANNAAFGAEYASITLEAALAKESVTVNPELKFAYENQTIYSRNNQGVVSSRLGARAVANLGGSFGMTNRQNFVTQGWAYDINEVTLAELEAARAGSTTDFGDYTTSIVVLGRINAEGRDFIPGEAGVLFQNSDATDATRFDVNTGNYGWSRNAGAKDPLGLSDDERAMINMAKTNSDKVVVLINSNSMMEIPEVATDDDIDAILWIGTPGSYGMPGVANILTGKTNPSGKLPDTYVYDNSASPAAQNWDIFTFTNLDEIGTLTNGQEAKTNGVALSAEDLRASAYTVYAEGIYVGYKYYETRYADSVLNPASGASGAKGAKEGATSWKYSDEVVYPFGYGLSYTTFTQTLNSVSVDKAERTVTAVVTVANTGTLKGKEAVQLYVSLPYAAGNVEKSAIQLLDYAKVELDGGASKDVTITADLTDMASYDSVNAKTYILDAGDYLFSVGNGSHEALNNVLAYKGKTTADGMDKNGTSSNVKVWNNPALDTTTCSTSKHDVDITNQLDNADLNYYEDCETTVTYLSRSNYTGTFPKKYEDIKASASMIPVLRNLEYKIRTDDNVTDKWGVDYGEERLTLAAMKGADFDDERWYYFLNQITFREAIQIIAQGGNTTWELPSIGNPRAKQADGPNGFSSAGIGQFTSNNEDDPHFVAATDPFYNFRLHTTPNAPIVAATFDKDLVFRFGEMIGNESLWIGSPIIWAGGANQHRAPYEGRTHEYFSEDAILSKYSLTQQCLGGREFGCIIGPKHFAFNAIEYNRYGLSEFMTEQAAREGDLRCFQGAFESGAAIGGMTAFNRIGASYINGHIGLMQNILRGEWAFKGILTTDMVNNDKLMVLGDTVMGGITMMANGSGVDNEAASNTAEGKYWEYANATNAANDAVYSAQLRKNMHYQWWAYANSNLLNGWNQSTRSVQLMTWWRAVILTGIIVTAVLAVSATGMYAFVTVKGKEKEDR